MEYPVRRIHLYFHTNRIDLWPSAAGINAISTVTEATEVLGVDIGLYAYSLKHTPPISSIDDLVNQQLILIRGYTYRGTMDFALSNTQQPPLVAPNHHAALELLQQGRGDYLINFSQPLEQALGDQKADSLNHFQLDEWPVVLHISTQLPDSDDIVAAFNQAINDLPPVDIQPRQHSPNE